MNEQFSQWDDDEFFARNYAPPCRKADDMRWFRSEDKEFVLSDDQMRALGRVVCTALTNFGPGDPMESARPIQTYSISDDDINQISTEIAEHLSAIFRHDISTYWVHYYTINKLTGNCRENLIFSFLPRLIFKKQSITLHFDRLADQDLVSPDDILDSSPLEESGGEGFDATSTP